MRCSIPLKTKKKEKQTFAFQKIWYPHGESLRGRKALMDLRFHAGAKKQRHRVVFLTLSSIPLKTKKTKI